MALSRLETAALDAFILRLRSRFGVRLEKVVLFGSRARGEGDEDSDLDVLALVAGLTRVERGLVLDDAADIERAMGLEISPLVRDPALWEPSLPLGRAIAEEGVLL